MISRKIKYSELRSTIVSVIDFMKTEYMWEDDSSLNSELEKDLGITGDDAYEMIEKFSKKYMIDISNFRFDQYFSPEVPTLSTLLLLPFYVLMLITFIIKTFLAFILIPVNKALSDRIYNFKIIKLYNRIFRSKNKNNLSLTIADLVVSAICKEFRRRNEVKLEFC